MFMGFQALKQCKMPGVNYGDQNIEDDGHKSHKVIQKFKMAAVYGVGETLKPC